MTASLPERAGRSVVTGALVLFAVWTLVYQVALFAQLPATPSLLVAALLGAGALYGLSRLDRPRPAEPLSFPGARAALAVVVVAVLATCLALAELRFVAVALGVVTALVALVLSSHWQPRLEAWRNTRASSERTAAVPVARPEASDEATSVEEAPPSARVLWICGWAAALVSGLLAGIIASPDGDDAYFVNLSTWAAERGRFPLRDTMISPDVFPAISGHSPPIHSIEGLIGAVAGLVGIEAGSVTYLLVPPVATALGALVLTYLISEAGIPAAPVALLTTIAYLWTAGRSGYGLGGFYAIRIWQGKAMLLSIVLPLVFLFGAKLIRTRSARTQALFAAALVASVGASNTAVFLVPVLVAGLVLGALALAEWGGALRLALWTLYPLAMAGLSVAMAPVTASDAQLRALGFDVARYAANGEPLRTVPGFTGMLAVTALAIGVGSLGIGHRALRVGAAGTIVTGGLAVLPPVREVLRDLGLWSVVWRMWWAIPIALLLAGTVGAAAHWASGRRFSRLAVGVTALAVALVPLVGGRWVGSPQNDSRWVSPLTWKVPPKSLARAKLVQSISASGDIVLVPSGVARTLAGLTVDVQPVIARPFYLHAYAPTPEAHTRERLVLQTFVDETTPTDPSRVADALDVLDVRSVCLRDHRGGGIRMLEDLGWQQVARERGITCLQQ
jgi:hypothetical protein